MAPIGHGTGEIQDASGTPAVADLEVYKNRHYLHIYHFNNLSIIMIYQGQENLGFLKYM